MKTAVATLTLVSLVVAGAIASPTARPRPAAQRIPIAVTSKGFEPASIPVKAGRSVVLVVTRTTEKTCAKEFVIADQKIRRALPLDQPVEIRLAPQKPGQVRFACGMDMVAGKLVVR